MASLDQLVSGMFFNPSAPPPALQLGNIAIDRDTAIAQTGMNEGVLSQNLQWDLGQLANNRAARGGYRSGQTTKFMGREMQLANQQAAQGRFDLNKTLMDLARQRFLTTVGIPL